MDQHVSERVGALETDVAVIQSNYVRRDEFADLRAEVRVGFARTEAKIDVVRQDMNARIDVLREEMTARIDVLREEMTARIDRLTATMLKWMFASQLSVAAMAVAAIKYL